MIYIMQIFRMLDIEQLDLFSKLFGDGFKEDMIDLGYENEPEEYVQSVLESHFGITIEDDNQLKKTTRIIMENKHHMAIKFEKLWKKENQK